MVADPVRLVIQLRRCGGYCAMSGTSPNLGCRFGGPCPNFWRKELFRIYPLCSAINRPTPSIMPSQLSISADRSAQQVGGYHDVLHASRSIGRDTCVQFA
jgi:hypothetical protein